MFDKQMSIILDLKNISYDCLYLSEVTNNNVIENGKFYRLNYSNKTINLNSLNIQLKMILTSEIISKNKKIYQFSIDNTSKEEIINLEKKILSLISTGYSQVNKLENIMSSGYFKLKLSNKSKPIEFNKELVITLSITGIWEINNEIGVNFKFIHQ